MATPRQDIAALAGSVRNTSRLAGQFGNLRNQMQRSGGGRATFGGNPPRNPSTPIRGVMRSMKRSMKRGMGRGGHRMSGRRTWRY